MLEATPFLQYLPTLDCLATARILGTPIDLLFSQAAATLEPCLHFARVFGTPPRES